MSLGERLLEYRKKKNMSQEEVAEKLNVTRQTVSKWETDQSSPDLDKIVPICTLFEISTEEFLTGVKKEEVKTKIDIPRNSKKRVLFLLSGIFMFFLSVIFVIVAGQTLEFEEGIVVGGFLGFITIGTLLIVYYRFLSKEEKQLYNIQKENKSSEFKQNNRQNIVIKRRVIEITTVLFTLVYLVISFATMQWQYTWLLWIVYVLVVEIIRLLFDLRSDKNE